MRFEAEDEANEKAYKHGMGFARIMTEPDGAAIYEIWAMILGARNYMRLANRSTNKEPTLEKHCARQ